ncbi:molybdopterin-guanine dinucleotide biosynthesis protein B [Rhodovibrionaceae bacterium A322]
MTLEVIDTTQNNGQPKVIGLAGWSGSGKTTLLCKLIPELTSRGYRVSTIKHAHHAFDVDTPGKDSYEHRAAGATEVLVTSANRWALMHENRGAPEPTLWDLLPKLSAVDLVIVEGFKREGHEKLEVFRRDNNKPLLASEDEKVVAVLSDGAVPETQRPVLDLNNIALVADFIIEHCQLTKGSSASPAAPLPGAAQ